MPKRRMISEQQPESESGFVRTGRCVKSACLGCCSCISNTCIRIWDCICETWDDLAECFNDRCCLYRDARRSDTRESDVGTVHKDTFLRSHDSGAKTKSTQTVSNTAQGFNTAIQNHKFVAQPLSVDQEALKFLSKVSKIKSPSTDHQQNSGQAKLVESDSTVVKQTTSQQVVTKQSLDGPVESHPRPTLEPPKIDFVETGSIFGDRKRSTYDPNALQIENGRFRSPGLSKTIQGPGGRTIRVSFVTGFPSMKSIESAKSLAASNNITKRSIESLAQVPTSRETIGKNMKSNKSYKSYASVQEQRELD